jgi:hypothetical protein
MTYHLLGRQVQLLIESIPFEANLDPNMVSESRIKL